MAEVTLNGRRVFGGEVTLTASGASFAFLDVDSQVTMTGAATLKAPGLTLVGTIDSTRSAAFQEKFTCLLTAGAGGLALPVTPRVIHARYASVVLRIAMDDQRAAGRAVETLASDIDPRLVGGDGTGAIPELPITPFDEAAKDQTPFFSITAGRFDELLASLVQAMPAGTAWRIREDDGRLWFGTHTWAEHNFVHQLISHDPQRRTFVVASERFTARPGRTFRGQRINEVRFEISPGATRSRLIYGDAFGTTLRNTIARLGPSTAPLKFYGGTVLAQRPDGSVDVRLDGQAVVGRGLDRVPVLMGAPGVRVRVLRGARVRVFFEDGDPQQPRAALWEEHHLEEISFDGGTRSVARVDDIVDGGTLYVVTAGTPPVVTAITHVPPGGAPVPGALPVPLSGLKIATGAANVKA